MMDVNLGSAIPPQYWLTAVGGLALALVIYILRPRRKVVPARDCSVSDKEGTPSDSTLSNGRILKTISGDTSGIISPPESAQLQSNHLSSAPQTTDLCEGSRDVVSQPFSGQGNVGMKESGIFSAGGENSNSNSSKLVDKFVQGKSKIPNVDNLAGCAQELTLREGESRTEILGLSSANPDDLVDLDSDIRDIENHLVECKQRIEDLEEEVDLEREGRRKAQNWTILLEKELDAHISARKATDDRCSKVIQKLKETKRTLKLTKRRCDQLEKIVSQLSLSSEVSEITDSSLGDSLLSSPSLIRSNRSGQDQDVEDDSLDDSDAETHGSRRDSLEVAELHRSSAERTFLGEHDRESQDSLEDLVVRDENGADIDERVVLAGDFNDPSGDFDDISDISVGDEFLDEEEDELAGMDSDSCEPGLTREEAEFELSKDIMEVIINNVQGDLSTMLGSSVDEDSLSDLLPDNLAVMEEDEIPKEISFTQAEISDESISNTKLTKKFWEQRIASDQETNGAGASVTSVPKPSSWFSDSEDNPENTRFQYTGVKDNWERSYTPDSLHDSDDVIGRDGSPANGGRSHDGLLGNGSNSSAFASIRDHWDKVHKGRNAADTADNDHNENPNQPSLLGPKIESLKQHWERALEDSPSPRSNSTHSDSLERSTDFSELKHHWDSFNAEDDMETSPKPSELLVENNNNDVVPSLQTKFGEIKSQWEQKASDADQNSKTGCTQLPPEGAT